MKIVSLILARGGSKGIPNKNIIEINGNPLLYYTANASLNSNVNETWVSTDCDKINNVAQNIGCKVIDRPKEISGDNSKSDEALVRSRRYGRSEYVHFNGVLRPIHQSCVGDNGPRTEAGGHDDRGSGE